jgi:hypothetical protein
MTVYRTNYTYGAVSTAFTPGTAPTDVFAISGSVTSNVYVTKMGISTTQTTEGINAWFLAKRSTANTGGTSAAPGIVSHNSNNPAVSASVLQYTANPTLGTLVGYVWGGWVNSPKAATAGVGGFQGIEVDFEDMFGQPICLLSTSEVLAWNFKGASLPSGLSVLAYCEWYEVSKS